jgi:hypothetical protein
MSNIKLIYYHYKGEKRKIMDKNQVISDKTPVYIPPTDVEMTDLLMVKVTPFEKQLFEMLTTILSELAADGKGTKVIMDNSLSEFIRMSLLIASYSYMYNIFPDSRVMSKLMSKKAKKEFIAFRKKYMDISNDFSS